MKSTPAKVVHPPHRRPLALLHQLLHPRASPAVQHLARCAKRPAANLRYPSPYLWPEANYPSPAPPFMSAPM